MEILSMDQAPFEPIIAPPVNPGQILTQTPTKSSHLPLIFGIFAVILLGICGFLGFQVYRLNQLVKVDNAVSPTSSAESAKSAEKEDPTADWKTYTNTILGIEYKLPQNFSLIDLSGKEIKGETGYQYCVLYKDTNFQGMKLVKQAYAGSGPCDGGALLIGSVSTDYSAGRSGGFGDYTGYEVKSGKYYPRFINRTGSTPIDTELATEMTNPSGIKYLKIVGKNNVPSNTEEGMPGPMPGTPGESYLGALFNLPGQKYVGFNISMIVSGPEDEAVFDQILSTIKFITSSPSSTGVYTDPLGFSFKIPSTVYFNSDSNYPNVTVKTNDLNQYEDKPSGYNLDNALKDQKALNNHETTVKQDWAEEKSISFTSLGSIPAKNFLVFARFITDDVVFNRILIFYYKNHQVIMTYSGDPTMISSANNYTKTQEYENTQLLVWDLENKKTEQLAVDLQNHKAPQTIQQWYDEFDTIISTFKFTN